MAADFLIIKTIIIYYNVYNWNGFYSRAEQNRGQIIKFWERESQVGSGAGKIIIVLRHEVEYQPFNCRSSLRPLQFFNFFFSGKVEHEDKFKQGF